MVDAIFPIYGLVYLITNLVNGKQYVGQTTTSLKVRFSRHINGAKYFKKGRLTPIKAAFLKYGSENLQISLLCTCRSKEELDLMEDLYIVLLDTMNSKIGYNVKRGGAYGKPSPEMLRYASQIRKGKKHSAEWNQHIKEGHARSMVKRPPVSDLTRERMRLRKGEKCPNFRRDLITEDLVGLYNEGFSTSKIAKMFSATPGTISSRIKKAGVILRSRSEQIAPKFKHEVDTNELVRLYRSGLNTTQLAEMFPLTKASIGTRIKKTGFEMRGRRGNKQVHPEQYS